MDTIRILEDRKAFLAGETARLKDVLTMTQAGLEEVEYLLTHLSKHSAPSAIPLDMKARKTRLRPKTDAILNKIRDAGVRGLTPKGVHSRITEDGVIMPISSVSGLLHRLSIQGVIIHRGHHYIAKESAILVNGGHA